MAKKRKSPRNVTKTRREPRGRKRPRGEKSTRLDNQVLSLLYSSSSPLSAAQLEKELFHIARGEKGDLVTTLRRLSRSGMVSKEGKNHYKLHKNAGLYEGKLTLHPRGFGFVEVSRTPKNIPPPKRDPFIASREMAGAHHGDRVLLRILRVRQDDRPEGSVVKILSQGTTRLAGIYVRKGGDHLVYPDDRRFPFVIRVNNADDFKIHNRDGVIVKFERPVTPGRYLQGRILELLGPTAEIDTQMRLVIEQFQLPFQFSDEVLRETEMIQEQFPGDGPREDLRTTPHVTIDGETAKDFDDAICVEKSSRGYRLFVSIADVSHFVKPGSVTDREAYLRGTSVYFPGRVIPMLPEKLSNDLCSLVPEEDRYTVSAILDFDHDGYPTGSRFSRSIIRSRQRFTYRTVGEILEGKDPALLEQFSPFLTGLKWSAELALLLGKRRRKRGAIDFNIPEPEFTLSESGAIASIQVTKRQFSHQIIEECMLAANQAVAELFTARKVPSLFRVHEAPELQKAEEFFTFTKRLGLSFGPFAISPAWFAGALRKGEDSKYQYIINNLMLRTMQQARYSDRNTGHFGLAADDYTHFTSPIRRYPDLLVHRQLIQLIEDKPQQYQSGTGQPSMKQAGDFLSTRERTAIMAEREMNERLKVGFMKDRIGESFEAIIAGVTDTALFVEIQTLCISGSIPVEFLTDDYYLHDKKNYRLLGEITGKTYQLGDLVQVTVVEVDLIKKRIHFGLTSAVFADP